MPITIQNRVVVGRPIEEVWKFFNRVAELGACVPSCQSVEVLDEDTVDVTLRLSVGLIPLEGRARVAIVERVPPTRLRASGVSYLGDSLRQVTAALGPGETESTLTMTLDLEDRNGTETQVGYAIEIEALGQLKRIYEAVIRGKRAKLEEEFLRNLGRVLQAEVGQPQGAECW
ncbi:MAG: hypothetical protein HYV08_18720 [Deltaproteobacteria bacterium]|nr:hypothetical protein [Deltaproteobacteria bacterium]